MQGEEGRGLARKSVLPADFPLDVQRSPALMGDRERAITTIAVTYGAREAVYIKCIYFVSAVRSAGNLRSIPHTEFTKFTIAYPLGASRRGFRDRYIRPRRTLK